MTTNTKISHLVSSQVPFFVRNDHANFIRFIEAYYEFLEQEGGLVDISKNVLSYRDIDQSIGIFEQKLHDTFLKLIPEDIQADKTLLLKHIKDFYRARGTEKSIRFLLNLLFGEQNAEFYYPKKDVLRASDGKWFIQKSLRVFDTYVNGVLDETLVGLTNFVGRSLTGNTSGATATVERVDKFYEKGTAVEELILIDILGTFENGETVFALYEDTNGITRPISANVFGGIINTVTVTDGGAGYTVGTHPPVEGGGGTDGNVRIDSVSTGTVASITVLDGGAGYQVNTYALFTGGGGGSGANAVISVVLDDESIHPNTYNIAYSTISLEANTPLNNTIYSNLNTTIVSSPNVNTTLADALQFFVYANTGPARTIVVNDPGSNYTEVPSISFSANTRVKELQILGRMEIVDGGAGYVIGDTIEFINAPGGLGTGAAANVTNVNGSGAITEVRFEPVEGQITGGSGYNVLPIANVITSTGSGADIQVTARLGEGGEYIVANTTLGAIQTISIINRGTGYTSVPTINLQSLGDGTATATATILQGVYTYPGRYLNDDGFISSYNFLQNRDYYQNFSYVLRLKESLANYRQAIKDLVHPAGTKLFGAYLVEDNAESMEQSAGAVETNSYLTFDKEYTKTGNAITIEYVSHGLYVGNTVYLEFTSGGTTNTKNGIYTITASNTDNISVIQPKSGVSTITITDGGAGYNSNSYLVFSTDDGKQANGTYTINSTGSIVTANITDYGFYYNSIPTVTANGSNSSPATFSVTLTHYANTTSGNVNVSVIVI
jgi:hypothetical protein